MPVYQFKIGSGWNVPAGSLVNIETIKPTGDVLFYPPESYGSFDPGDEKDKTNSLTFHSGYDELKWTWRGKITRKQARYLMDSYCGGGYSGTVTINTPTDTPDTYVRKNAVMKLPKLPDATRNFKVFTLYTVTMRRLKDSS